MDSCGFWDFLVSFQLCSCYSLCWLIVRFGVLSNKRMDIEKKNCLEQVKDSSSQNSIASNIKNVFKG